MHMRIVGTPRPPLPNHREYIRGENPREVRSIFMPVFHHRCATVSTTNIAQTSHRDSRFYPSPPITVANARITAGRVRSSPLTAREHARGHSFVGNTCEECKFRRRKEKSTLSWHNDINQRFFMWTVKMREEPLFGKIISHDHLTADV
jgi:hypothetical protein